MYMSLNIYYNYSKGERSDADEYACRRLTVKVSQKSLTKISQLDVCKPICLHKSFLLKYNNNKYLRTCKYLQKSLLVACEYT